METVEENSKTFVCEYCGKSYKTNTWLSNHVATKHADKLREYTEKLKKPSVDNSEKVTRLVDGIFGEDVITDPDQQPDEFADLSESITGGAVIPRAAFDIVVSALDGGFDLNGHLTDDVADHKDTYDDILLRLSKKYGINTTRFPEVELTVMLGASTYRAYGKRRREKQDEDDNDDFTDDDSESETDDSYEETPKIRLFKPTLEDLEK